MKEQRLLDFKSYHNATVIKISRNWHKDRQIDQSNSMDSGIDPYIYHQLIFDRQFNRERKISSKNNTRTTGYPAGKN